jgi:alpha,alpha-trehalose phosphorylase
VCSFLASRGIELSEGARDALAGAWIAAVAGFGGMRDHNGVLSFKPRLPQALTRLTFRLMFRGRRLRVEIGHARATYTLLDGQPLEITLHGEAATVTSERPLRRPIPPPPAREPPRQPPGRAPARRPREVAPGGFEPPTSPL